MAIRSQEANEPSPPPVSGGCSTRRVLLVGWDAADWKMIDPLMVCGHMPNLKRLVDRGVRADLASLDPKLSPLLWTTIATGKTADRHGILNFLEPDVTGRDLTVSASTSRRTKALWNMLTQAGLRSVVVNWYASHPAEPIRGAVVSNVFQDGRPQRAGGTWTMADEAVHPPGVAADVARLRVHPDHLPAGSLLPILPRLRDIEPTDPRIGVLRAILAQNASVHRAALELLAREPAWDCAMLFYDAIDVAGHHFMAYHPPRMDHVATRDFALFRDVMSGVYRLQDAQLGELMRAAGPDATVMVVSDHGFHSDHLRPRAAAAPDDPHAAMDATWHRPMGVLAMSGPGVRSVKSPDDGCAGATLLDIAPTVLTLLGLPIGADMDGRVLIEALDDEPVVRRIPSWDAAEGEAGMHPPDRRREPLAAGDALRHLVELGYISEDEIGPEGRLAMVDRETRFNLGVVLMTTRRPEQAAPVFRRLHEERPDEPRFALNLAHSLQAAGDVPGASAVLERLLEVRPDLTEAATLRAAALVTQQRLDEARGVLELAAGRATSDRRAGVLRMLGEVLTQLGRLDDARRPLQDALNLDGQDARTRLAMAKLDLAAHRFDAAAGHALDALELTPRDPEAHFVLGVALAWLDELADAARSFEMALSLLPGMIEVRRFLEAIHTASGDPATARKHAQAAAALEERAIRSGARDAAAPRTPSVCDAAHWAARRSTDERAMKRAG